MNIIAKLRSLFSGLTVWTLVFITALIIFITVSSYLDYVHQRNNIMEVWQEQGDLLSKTILHSGRTILASDRRLEISLETRMKDLSSYFRELDSLNFEDRRRGPRFQRFRDVRRALFLDAQLRLEYPGRFPRFIADPEQFRSILKEAIRLNDEDYFPIPPAPGMPPELPPALVIRRTDEKGYIVVFPDRGLQMGRERIKGVRHWLAEVVENPGIHYVHLGRGSSVLAHEGIIRPEDLPALSFDPGQSSLWRMVSMNEQRIFEYVHRAPDGTTARIGLSTEELEHIQSTHIRRLILYTVFILLILVTFSFYTMKKQSLSLLEHKYRQVQTYSSAIIEEMNDGLIVLDGAARIRTINRTASRILNLTRDLQGENISVLSGNLPQDLLNRLRQLDNIEDYPLRLTSAGPSYRHLLVSTGAFPFEHGDNSDRIYLILLRDYTSQKELETLRQRRSKLLAMGQLASRVAHEIRNPLNGIGMLAQRIRKEYQPEQDSAEFDSMTQSIREETSRINTIIETFLAYARTPDLKLKPVPLEKLIRETLPVLSSLCEEKHISLKTELAETHPLQMDMDQMKQVLINLVKNAVEAAPEYSTVAIHVTEHDQKIAIEIEDEGQGIPPEQQDHIFDLYYTTKENGSGLGLSIVEKIVSAHGGEIQVESPLKKAGNLKAGSRFRILFPEIGENQNPV